MAGRRSKYTPKMDGELKMRVIAVLDKADDSVLPTIDWIKSQDMFLMPHTQQKLSRILGSLADMNIVQKAKDKHLGRMVYRLTSKMKEAGYEVKEPDYDAFLASTPAYRGISWEAEVEKELMNEQEETNECE